MGDANGMYQVADRTIGGKPHWVLNDSFGNVLYHLYSIDEPTEAWVIGSDGAGPHQSDTMALITLDCDAVHFSSIKWP